MAHDDRKDPAQPGWGRETQWQGDDSFGGGWGNQIAPSDGADHPGGVAPEGALFGADAHVGEFAVQPGRQPDAAARVREHMEVVGADGGHVGIVDKLRGEGIVLTRTDDKAGGVHHRIPCAWIASVDRKVTLSLSAAEAMAQWREEGRSRALFEREDSGSDGPHMLDRAFAGTYSGKK